MQTVAHWCEGEATEALVRIDATEVPLVPVQVLTGIEAEESGLQEVGRARGYTFWRDAQGFYGVTRGHEQPVCSYRRLEPLLAYKGVHPHEISSFSPLAVAAA